MTDLDGLSGRAVLVIDDDRETLELFGLVLTKVGARVETVRSAEAALALLATWRPDVVLCDLHLPGVDGYGFLERLRANRALGDLPVIAISGSHPGIERQRCLRAGFDRHLSKPSKLHDIVAALAAAIPHGGPSAST